MLGGDVVFSLALAELHHWNSFPFGEGVHGRDEGFTDGVHQRTGGELAASMKPEEAGYARIALQLGDVHVQIHPVNPFHLKGDVLGQYFRDASCYAHFRLRWTPILRDRLPPRRPISWARTACGFSTVDRSHFSHYAICTGLTEYNSSV